VKTESFEGKIKRLKIQKKKKDETERKTVIKFQEKEKLFGPKS